MLEIKSSAFEYIKALKLKFYLIAWIYLSKSLNNTTYTPISINK